LHQPIYDKRMQIVTGQIEPDQENAPQDVSDVKGIPEFWLTSLKNLGVVAEMITEKDEEVLKHLVDIKVRMLEDNPGFTLDFVFEPNEFFENAVLSKTYHLMNAPEQSFAGSVIYDHAHGTDIKWKEGKDLSVVVEVKKQKHKGTGKTRTVKKTVPAETFFSFFTPPKPPNDEDDVDDEEYAHLDEKLEFDYEVGEQIKEKLIPHAIDWFTGEALQYEDDEYDDEFDGESDDEPEESDQDDEDGDDSKEIVQDNPPECKQQ